MTTIERYRYRIRFEKSASIRFIGHLDLHRTWERTLRRAALPVYHSQGFNPRPKINLSRALPLGQTSECELMDVWLVRELDPAQVLERLRECAPPGLIIRGIHVVPLSEASLQSRICSAVYLVNPGEQASRAGVEAAIERLLGAQHLMRVRRKKEYDLRPLVESLLIEADAVDGIHLKMRLAAREGATGRPEEVLLEMGLDPTLAQIHRTALILENSTGE